MTRGTFAEGLQTLSDRELRQLRTLVVAETKRRKQAKHARAERQAANLAETLAESVWLVRATKGAP